MSLLYLTFFPTDQSLVLEQAPGRDKKRRATDFLFRRLRVDEIGDVPQLSRPPADVSSVRQEKQRSASQNDDSGIPQIRTTLPGDEVKDMKALKAAIKSQVDSTGEVELLKDVDDHQPDLSERAAPSPTPTIRVPTNARRFHLSREHNVLGPLKQHGGIRKSAHHPKTHLATFIEKGFVHKDKHTQNPSKAPPIDRIVEGKSSVSLAKPASDSTNAAEDRKESTTKRTFNQPFVKLSTNGAKTGHTINTHPDTWDFDSDQLASELAAFAFELDPIGDNEPLTVQSKPDLGAVVAKLTMEEEFVYETYIRLPHNADIQTEIERNNLTANFGILVIAEEDEDLWEAYADSDGENDWDEEDADSNGGFAPL